MLGFMSNLLAHQQDDYDTMAGYCNIILVCMYKLPRLSDAAVTDSASSACSLYRAVRGSMNVHALVWFTATPQLTRVSLLLA
jgi:hypothetical protein